jgi:hypothetical protein
MTRSVKEVDLVQGLLARGAKDADIARATGIPRTTVRDWRRGAAPGPQRLRSASACRVCGDSHDAFPDASYAYLLGMYLGDGCISEHPRTFRLRITLDGAYPGIINECITAIAALRPGRPVRQGRHGNERCVEVSSCWQHWPCLFPQHGPGQKHLRLIHLQGWQAAILDSTHPYFLRGLIHSDGCRIVANDRGRLTARYHFSNRSEDIKKRFCSSLEAMGVHWTRPCEQQIAVYRKDDVALLDRFIGPKL